jgi:alpha-L-fucosidase
MEWMHPASGLSRRQALRTAAAGWLAARARLGTAAEQFLSPIGSKVEPMAKGRFEPTWESLGQYQAPEWYRNAKFGIWAHWGSQCQPEYGDWYARNMYIETHADYKFHLEHYGHPSKFGFKDVIRQWKAENWDPDKLIGLYKRAGAQYFVALANHHDNFDNWDSRYQPWNSVRLGPRKDLVGGWARAARAQGLRFGVSVHASHAWMWYEVAQGADKSGSLAGVAYDGKLRKSDGKGQWWDGFDPQDLYAQGHTPGKLTDTGKLWDWPAGVGASIPDVAYCERFYNRTVDLIDKYRPDLVYYDDTALPLYPISDAGLRLAAHLYNSNMKLHGGRLEAVLNAKGLKGTQRKAMIWDIERGQATAIEPEPWQTDTCIGNWHYDRRVLEQHRYKTAATVVRTLADIVSKNGNLLLSVPVKGDGTIDSDEVAVVEGITRWMDINRECIFGTRPWKVFGEGPGSEAAPLRAQGFNEGRGKPVTPDDVRFTTRGDAIYIIEMGVPTRELRIKSCGNGARLLDRPIDSLALVGSGEKIEWKQGDDALSITPPRAAPAPEALVYKMTLKR